VSSATGPDVWDRAWIGWDVAFATALSVEVIGALYEMDGAAGSGWWCCWS